VKICSRREVLFLSWTWCIFWCNTAYSFNDQAWQNTKWLQHSNKISVCDKVRVHKMVRTLQKELGIWQ